MPVNRWVSSFQIMIIAINLMVGSSLLMLPRAVAEAAKQDMWLSVLVTGVVFAGGFCVAAALASYFPDHTAIEYHRLLLGKIGGAVLNFIMLAFMVITIAQFMRVFRIAVKIFLLDMTPSQVIIISLLILALYAAQHGLAPVIRVQEFLGLFVYSIFLVLILLGLLAVEQERYTPVLAEGIVPVLKGSAACWMAYSGPELAVGLLYPYAAQRESIVRFVLAGLGAVTFLYTLIAAITLGILGPDEVADFLIPTIMAYRMVDIPDTFVERIDGYLMIVWIAICFNTLVNWLYLTGFGVARMLKIENSRPVMALLVPVIVYLADLAPDIRGVILFGDLVNYIGMAWGLGIIPGLWLLARRRGS